MTPSLTLKAWAMVFYLALAVWFLVALHWFLRIAQEALGVQLSTPLSLILPEHLTLLWMGYWFALVCAGLVFMNWENRALQYVQPENPADQRFSPDAVAWWICPVIHLWRPREVMRWLWRLSTGREDMGLIGFWWVLWLGVLVGSWGLYWLGRAATLTGGGEVFLLVELVVTLALALNGLITAWLVGTMTKCICWRLAGAGSVKPAR